MSATRSWWRRTTPWPWCSGAVDNEGLEVSDEDAYEVIRGLLAYLDRIGALGPPA